METCPTQDSIPWASPHDHPRLHRQERPRFPGPSRNTLAAVRVTFRAPMASGGTAHAGCPYQELHMPARLDSAAGGTRRAEARPARSAGRRSLPRARPTHRGVWARGPRPALINPWSVSLVGVEMRDDYTILGCDLAGTVLAVGRKVTRFAPGDQHLQPGPARRRRRRPVGPRRRWPGAGEERAIGIGPNRPSLFLRRVAIFFYLLMKGRFIPHAIAAFGLVATVFWMASALVQIGAPTLARYLAFSDPIFLLAETLTGVWLLVAGAGRRHTPLSDASFSAR